MSPHPLIAPGRRRLVVTGHPNHELAIFGFVQRVRPHFLFLTDGGGAARVAESERALASLGLMSGARFLPTPERCLYDALLDADLGPFVQLVDAVRSEILATSADDVICESVEFYNPLHDTTLPIVWAATRGLPHVRVWEFPLIAELPAPAGADRPPAAIHRVQRPRADRTGDAIAVRLTPDELRAKVHARGHAYPSLHAQLGSVIDAFDDAHLSVEYFNRALAASRDPDGSDSVRYEHRGRTLLEQGLVTRVITYNLHVRPMVAALGRLSPDAISRPSAGLSPAGPA